MCTHTRTHTQPHSFSVTSSATELLLSSSQPHTSTPHTSTTSSKSAQAQHTGPQGECHVLFQLLSIAPAVLLFSLPPTPLRPPGKHVHPANVMYPQMMPQYPFGMMVGALTPTLVGFYPNLLSPCAACFTLLRPL